MALTVVADTLYSAYGLTTAADVPAPLAYVIIAWPSFFNFANSFIPAETTIITAAAGTFTANLEPSSDSSPPFSYSVVYQFSDGTRQSDVWNVPRSATTQKVYQVHAPIPALAPSSISLSLIASSGATIGQPMVYSGAAWGPSSTVSALGMIQGNGILTPTIAAGAGAGTGPTIAVAGSTLAGKIILTTGTTPAANSTICTLTFPNTFTVSPFAVVGSSVAISWDTTTSTLTLLSGVTPLAASTLHSFTFICIG